LTPCGFGRGARCPVTQPIMTADLDSIESASGPLQSGGSPCDKLLATLALFQRVVLVSHVNPDPDSLASMLGVQALLESAQPGKPVILTVDGMIARSENRAMVELLQIPLVPVESVSLTRETAVVMVDTQPYTGRRFSEAAMPQVVIDHHDTGGLLEGVLFYDIRASVGATSTIVTNYLIEKGVTVTPRLATALLYGIESETTGYPREATPLDDSALIWLFPRADKDLLAHIRNPKLPQSHFATFQTALANAFIYDKLVVTWCGTVTQPDIIAEVADFFIRFEEVDWSLSVGVFDGQMKLSLRADWLGGKAGEVLYEVLSGLGNAGGHDKRAGGAIMLAKHPEATPEQLLRSIRHRLLDHLDIDEQQGRRLINGCPVIPAP
jgi:nanoRNase/pAp phosphatase (c-di-AMP/oligoRNAs hydrolase)